MPKLTRDLLLGLAVSVLPAFGVLPAVFSRRAAEFEPFTDQALLEIQVLHATRGLHLLGPYSRYHWNHPGPFFFYLMAPGYALSDHRTASIWLSVWLVNVACLAAIVWVVHGIAGRSQALLVGVLLAAQSVCLRLEHFCDPWGPLVVVLPLELLLFVCVAIGAGRRRWLPLAVLTTSFLVQTHVATLPVCLSVLATATIAAVVSTRGERREAASDASPWVRPALVSLAVALLVWWPSIVEELKEAHGNLAKLWTFFSKPHPRHSVVDAFSAISDHIAALLFLDPTYGARAWASAVLRPTSAALVATAALFAATCVTFAVAVNNRQRYFASGCAISAVGMAAAVYAGTRAVGPLMSYLFTWTAGLGTLAIAVVSGMWVELALRALSRVESAGTPLSEVALGWLRLSAIVASILAAYTGASAVADTPWFYGRPKSDIEPLARGIEERLGARNPRVPVIRIASADVSGIVTGVVLQLYKRNVRIFVEGDWAFMFGREFALQQSADMVFSFGDGHFHENARHDTDSTLVAESNGTFLYEMRHPLPAASRQ